MDFSGFTSVLEQRGCVSNGKDFCGVYEDIPFAVTFQFGKPDDSTTFSLRVQFEAKPAGRFFSSLRGQMKSQARVQKIIGAKNLVNLTVTAKKGQPFEAVFDKLFAELDAAITQNNMRIPSVCPICGRHDCDSYANVGLAYQKVHAHCVQTQSADVKAKVERNEESGSYILGFIGALVGGMVGMIPTILLVLYLQLISGWLCALVPLCAYYGYKILRGKLGRGTLGIIVAVSIVMAPVTQFFIELCGSIKDGWGAFSPLFFIEVYRAYPEELLPNLMQILLFMGIGFLLVFRIVSRNNTHLAGQADFSMASLRPMNQPVADSGLYNNENDQTGGRFE
jgi:hypothetical protein